ncbi:Glycoside hydrolase family 28 protein [Mycena indigotica]|uniref:galacturonan 1,4-alpha-galacturonidase n=1 Tax=Mycena indigotica TaxID=2126181 RepID=A0A8H6W943_9AGAR|nr:Glycoside hydrolase family 28 protein [Mycena indigotica]KAF7307636.1 Glycoside hydrolase family 28 protein [Mycena indigotica]
MLTRNALLLPLLQFVATVLAWDTFVVPHTPDADDTPGLLSLVTSHPANATILFSKGTTYNAWSAIKFPVLNNVEIRIEGNLTYPNDIATIQAIVGASGFPGSWFTFSGGNNVTLRGSTDPKWGWVDGHGQQWWDANQQVNRPHGWAFSKINNGVIRDMKLWKPIAWNFATSGAVNVHAFDNLILASSDTNVMLLSLLPTVANKLYTVFPFQHVGYSYLSAPTLNLHSDGFSAGGTNLVFENNYIVNGDDCLTVGNGARNITWRNSYCEGGHGLSIGSLGKGGSVADVQNVHIENTVMKDSLYGARFKSWTGGNGLARNITWKNIAFDNVMFPIYVTQNYWDQGIGPKPNTTTTNNTHIQDFTFVNFAGTIRDTGFVEGSCVSDPCWYAVPNATGREVVILDLYPGTASNILAKDIFAVTETGRPVAAMCNSTTVTNDVGFKCWNGAFIRTKAGL